MAVWPSSLRQKKSAKMSVVNITCHMAANKIQTRSKMGMIMCLLTKSCSSHHFGTDKRKNKTDKIDKTTFIDLVMKQS